MTPLPNWPYPVTIHRHPRSRRLSLRLLPCRARLKVVAPPCATEADIAQFLRKNQAWIEARLQPSEKTELTTVPLRGKDYLLRRHPPHLRPKNASALLVTGDSILLYCHPEHCRRRLLDFLKKEARAELTTRARTLSKQEGLTLHSVRIKDTQSRWGSCSAKGNLNFSWRLILAPGFVCDYVVAHEVAHLKHLDHSATFWSYLGILTPHRTTAEQWLKQHGATLHSFGQQKI